MKPYSPKLGDVICTENMPRPWEAWESIPKWRIQTHQREIGLVNWRHTHAMLYIGAFPSALRSFAPWKLAEPHWTETIAHCDWLLSVTWPRTKFVRWSSVKSEVWDAYRHRAYDFVAGTEDSEILWKLSLALWGSRYDDLQLLNIALNRRLCVPGNIYWPLLDFHRDRLVCSVGVRRVLSQFRAEKRARGRAFSVVDIATGKKPDPLAAGYPFEPLFVTENGMEVKYLAEDMTTPAHFANSRDWVHVGRA